MADDDRLPSDFLRLARAALAGRSQDVQSFLASSAKRHRDAQPELAMALTALLREAPSRTSPLRGETSAPVPVDIDTRLALLKVESPPTLDCEPIFTDRVRCVLDQVVRERRQVATLLEAGLEPSRSMLFSGPPGVGKTLAARWLARELHRPLLMLDLAAVMSSFLGRTGANLRYVLDYAKSVDCILLLDELDAIAKRRDDSSEVGELKRLVTVLLQEIDDWPTSSILVAATNHAVLLDPAIWRRFDVVAEFALPDEAERTALIFQLLNGHVASSDAWAGALAIAFEESSFSDIRRDLLRARRTALLAGSSLTDALTGLLALADLSRSKKILLAEKLACSGLLSQRRISELLGVARDTVRARTRRLSGGS
jgi:hypothetical protein